MPKPKHIAPNTNPDELGDTVSPWDAWLDDQIETSELPPELQEGARRLLATPVLKHGDPSRPGYAQMHPNGAGSAYAEWGDHAGRIAAAEDRGPSEDMLRIAADGGGLVMPSENEITQWIVDNRPDDIDMVIDNEYSLYQRRQEIEETEYESDYRKWQDERDLRHEAAYSLAVNDGHLYAEAMGRGTFYDENERRDAFAEVYDFSHSGVNKDGDPVDLIASVESVDQSNGKTTVYGMITDGDGNPVGEFQRRFFSDDNGDLAVEHELLRIWEPDMQGSGFGTEFNAQAEDYYISHGIKSIRVHAGLDTGGYTWASAGFDFNPANATHNARDINQRISTHPEPDRFAGVQSRMKSLKPDDPDYPTPFEISRVGWTPGAETWPGKEVMLGSNWYGVKPLRPEGRRLSTTEQA
jgi:hypothetical protein